MEGYRRNPRRNLVLGKAWGLQDRSKTKDKNKRKVSAKNFGERGNT